MEETVDQIDTITIQHRQHLWDSPVYIIKQCRPLSSTAQNNTIKPKQLDLFINKKWKWKISAIKIWGEFQRKDKLHLGLSDDNYKTTKYREY